jgi:hypothetical protein
VLALVSIEVVMMCPSIDSLARSQIRSDICFLRDNNISAAEICLELCAIYGQNKLSERTVRQWCRLSKEGGTIEKIFKMKSEVVGLSSTVSDDFIVSVDEKKGVLNTVTQF